MSLIIEHALAKDETFRARVHLAFLHVAQEVAAEPADTPGHPLRVSLARSLYAPELSSDGYAPAVATCPAVSAAAAAAYSEENPAAAQAAVSDDVVLDAVRSLWNSLCGHNDTTPAPAVAE
ncbi:hypothetical protein SEA_GILGAMESH_73 [Streptomyces phage Gilgamesh]|uniref:Uncharacterized protein n=1 Tax=Streptomyces phage Gilgamesh TaxID=2599890 RepID=A0A5J6TR57_9CAUD|nr:hypothetical protein QEH35_gp073 [Streptomyces phage Gilgamesh]QFG13265.1 hypothetical protein SEA_GILGAMESH_73 [Streptomyces phage Gilgamesh]